MKLRPRLARRARPYLPPGWPLAFVWAVLAVLALEGLRLLVDAPFAPLGLLARVAFVVAVVAFVERGLAERRLLGLPLWGFALLLLGAAWLAYRMVGSALSASLLIGAYYVVLLWVERFLTRRWRWFVAWPVRLALGLLAGGAPVVVGQLESQFADEEFFVALEALALGAVWLLLWAAGRAYAPQRAPRAPRWARPALALYLLLLVAVGAAGVVGAYQRSFAPPVAPGFPGITPEAPFSCGSVEPDTARYDGAQSFGRLLARVEANPNKSAAEFGLLAVGTGDMRRARVFRDALLGEARAGMFTRPADSVKSVQHKAAARAYYYLRAQALFPELFSADDTAELRAWFAAINRRALTVEWVDWLYAVAFAKPPEGPYENQESGAGLLAILERGGLAAPDLSAANRDYLTRNERGWRERFRNTDDAPIYQPEWIRNALLQADYTGQVAEPNRRLSFEWLLLQALPDGSSLRQNHPGLLTNADIGYLGATLLDDPRYIWLAGRALEGLDRDGPRRYLAAQIGMDRRVEGEGRSPSVGSCLIYGDSGLPNVRGPLAPDKIVFRDGWAPDSTYLMLNLRFSGWHRYKATNAVALLYAGGPLVVDELAGQKFRWLPEGRSLFRDKRLPRENLNGLLVARTGMSAALYGLTGVGGPWAQDPPYYARVDRWQPGGEVDISSTVIEGWRGWRHRRTVHFYHNGPLAIVDDASGPAGPAALSWHVVGEPGPSAGRVTLPGGVTPAELVFVPIEAGIPEFAPTDAPGAASRLAVTLPSQGEGRLRAATVLLRGPWAGASVEPMREGGRTVLQIAKGQLRLDIPLDQR